MKIRASIYTGNGTSQSFRFGLGKPAAIFVNGQLTATVFATTAMAADFTLPLAGAGGSFSGGITSIDSDGFTVGTDSRVNTSGSVYLCILLYDDGAGDLSVGSYAGTSSAHAITLAGTWSGTPNAVIVKVNASFGGWFATSDMPTGQALPFSNSTLTTQRITALGSGTFSVGTNQNTNTLGNNYYYIAMKNNVVFNVLVYAGDGNEGHSVTTAVRPDVAILKGNNAQFAIFRTQNCHGADGTYSIANTGQITDAITELDPTAILLGQSLTANASTINFYGLIFREALLLDLFNVYYAQLRGAS
jgi:hypothetical protein